MLTIGASEVGRIRKEWCKEEGAKLEVGEEIRVRGRLSREEGNRVEKALEQVEFPPDRIVIGGPGNSLMAHEGVGVQRGGGQKGCVQREVVVKTGADGAVHGLETVYHLVEPGKLNLCERKQVAKVLVNIAKRCRDLWPLCDIVYMSMPPRHVDRCCNSRGHMTEVDPQVIHRSRLDLEEDIVDELRRSEVSVVRWCWWEALGCGEEPSLDWVRHRRVVCGDGVHLNRDVCELVAGHLLRRLEDGDLEEMEQPVRKRMSTW